MTETPRALPTKPWLTAQEVAAFQGCSVESVYAKARAGKLPYKLHGTRTYRFAREAVLELDRRAKTVPVPIAKGVPASTLDAAALAGLFRRMAEEIERMAA